MKLHILSDLHNEFSLFDIPKTEADIVILAGDIDVKNRGIAWAENFKKPVLYLMGNHEYYGSDMSSLFSEATAIAEGSSVQLMENSVVVMDNVRFVACTLWTDFCLDTNVSQNTSMYLAELHMADFRVINKGSKRFSPIDSLELHNASKRFLEDTLKIPFEGKTVVITHHGPSEKSCVPQYKGDPVTPAFMSDLEYLMDYSIDLWIHGHTHSSLDYEINGTRVICNPRGNCKPGQQMSNENPHFDPEFIVEV